jgi:hypothetical protein
MGRRRRRRRNRGRGRKRRRRRRFIVPRPGVCDLVAPGKNRFPVVA